MRRRLTVLTASCCALVLAGAGPAAAGPYDDQGQVRNILPPGSNGSIAVGDLLELGVTNLPQLDPSDLPGSVTTATATTPRGYADQLELYDGLNTRDPSALTPKDLATYFKDAKLGVDDADVVSTETPRPGTVIKRDRFGVPHITGATYEDVLFGSGYANIQDRMFLTDVLRHTGAATMSSFVGPSPGNLAMDQSQLRIAAYTPAQAAAQAAGAAQRYGAEGARVLKGLDAMIAGMNAAQRVMCPAALPLPLPGAALGLGAGVECPVEYAALQKAPTDYTRADIVYIASLVGGIFGKGGGGEADNARWLQQLQSELGAAQGLKVFNDLRMGEDASAPTTSPVRQPYGPQDGSDPTLPGVALPDVGGVTAPGTGAVLAGAAPAAAKAATRPGVVDGPFGPIDLGLRPRGMSNALLVDGEHGTGGPAGGHPVVVFGPQTGYFTPQLLVEQDLSGPGIQARGVSFAGTNLVVELGHGVDYAWSATSASNDIVDTVVERLCNTGGGAPTVQSTGYLVDGTCRPMEQYTHSQLAVPNAGSPNPPAQIDLLVLKTRHGVVQTRTTVDGKPVAVVLQRSTYGREVDSVIGFARFGDPGFVKDAASFQRAAHAIDYTFNWFYVDDRDIAYFSSGLLPDRPAGVDWDLPRWGDRKYDATRFLPFAAHPRVINPSTGYLVSWNNKTAPGFRSADNQWGYGPVYRSLALEDRVKALVRKGGVTPAQLTGAMIDAATVDVRAVYVLPAVLDAIGTPADPAQAQAVRLLRAWIADGAHRVDRDRDGAYDEHQAAIALLDAWWEPDAALGGTHDFALPRDVLRGALGDLVDVLPQGLDDHPRQGQGSSWNGVFWYGAVLKDLRSLLGRPSPDPFSRRYCGDGSSAACRTDLRASLGKATAAVLAAQAKASVAALTYDKHQDDITPTTGGLVGVRPIDWQNRPTFQQVVRYTGHRPRAVAATPPVAQPETERGPLAATGPGWALPLLGLTALLGAALARRRVRGAARPSGAA